MRLEGARVAEQVTDDLINRCNWLNQNRPNSKIIIFRLGNNPEDISYEQRILKNCDKINLKADVVYLDETIKQEKFIQEISGYNEQEEVIGILIFRPLPEHLNEAHIGEVISPHKDIDCMNPVNLKKLFLGELERIAPCTPEAVMELIKYYNIPLKGKRVVVVNRSMVLGKPLALLLLEQDATVTVCHSKTEDLAKITSEADIVITGIGKANYFGKEYFKAGGVVIDVGINFTPEGMCGDVDYESVSDHVSAITPVPGGIGTVTSMILLRHALQKVEQ
ncbi:bifunctional 5,10-methylenetetrahydrofolate dehydrogenase/5,10-methenyltetrahydrofolate cyclohydrolase [Sinanaerobacter sp. ZZT-01]|uniref:bifunctional 5,10-methylenetetrahydrofolate dehydrogenase/5,10-methenyltetrahydrofolate cyclohydrolase n=1 Tax=Sinanaerobacter sp. ZZT-01 TaxID=3111540 RepID=UPI002D7A2636|nr:bifunctional 5,10-methylenetetrahydrofolate dehydrogenase/5,10-methenyltetrahydrofolate cyclohydrolase [Sinanaerobacter sp. ZZT-01]WRR93204.1 bifunctional 5,10-methylenetetrahydrofolate dehydrogenase/5,10-methenyltetrahydrofolate cyclohydrolase [Sinanaerobacter sp. ZZT-01]